LKGTYRHKIQQLALLLIGLIAAGFIFIPKGNPLLEHLLVYAPQIMIFLLVISFMFLFLEQKALMVAGLIATSVIAFQLKNASNENYILPGQNQLQQVEVLMIKLENQDISQSELLDIILTTDPDIIVFYNYTIRWDGLLHTQLFKKYTHNHKIQINSNNGIGLFSRKKIFRIDNFYYQGIPNLKVVLDNNESKLTLLATDVPGTYALENQRIEDHLNLIVEEIKSSRYPVIALGDFNRMYWSNELVSFMKASNLQNSRRSVSIDNMNPEDHIFFSKRLECTLFQEIKTKNNRNLGLRGSYQVKQ